MALAFADFLNGSDSTGTGLIGAPFKTIQKAITDFPSWVASGGNVLRLADTAPFVLSSTITFNGTIGNNNNNRDAPFTILSYSPGGGSQVITYPNGASHPCYDIDGDDAVTILFESLNVYFNIGEGRLHDCTSYVLDPASNWQLRDCEVFGSGNSNAVIDGGFSDVDRLYLKGNKAVTTQDGIECIGTRLRNSFVTGCSGYGIKCNGTNNLVAKNVVDDCTLGAVQVTTHRARIIENTLIGESGNTGIGVSASGSNVELLRVDRNIVKGFATGIETLANNSNILSVRGNRYYDNTDDENFLTTPNIEEDNLTESSDPLTDSANGDYSVKTSALSYQAFQTAYSQNPLNTGADQTDNASGGGGGDSTQRRPRLQILN